MIDLKPMKIWILFIKNIEQKLNIFIYISENE